MENPLDIFIRICGSVEKAAGLVSTSQQNLSSWRNGRTWVKYPKALRIAKYLWLVAKRQIDPLTLVSPTFRNEMKLANFSFTHRIIESTEIPIKKIICNDKKIKSIEKNIVINELKTLIVDENYQIITNAETYFAYKNRGEKTISIWRISLLALLQKEYCLGDLEMAFSVMERTAIGMALERLIGNRQGQRTDLNNKLGGDAPTSQIKKGDKTRIVVSKLLGLGDKTYRFHKKILKHGSNELIAQVDQKKISIFKAARLAKLTFEEQLRTFKINNF